LDLGYTSSSDCKLIASVVPEGGIDDFVVHTTPDGMGLVIYFSDEEACDVYEIYPQNETPRLSQIAHIDFDPPTRRTMTFLLPDTVVWCESFTDRMVFRVWDYRLNHSISFVVEYLEDFVPEVIATKTAVIILCKEGILIVAIPPLSPQPPDFSDYNSARIPPLFTISYPDGLVLHPACNIYLTWKMVSSWYSDSSHPFYFDMLCQDSKRHRFQIKLKPDLSSASLHDINTSEHFPLHHGSTFFKGYRICDDTLVSWHLNAHANYCLLLYTGLMSATFSNVISHSGPASEIFLPDIELKYDLTLCPASGRLARLDASNSVTVLDFF